MAGSVKRRTFLIAGGIAAGAGAAGMLWEQAHMMHFYNHLTEITT